MLRVISDVVNGDKEINHIGAEQRGACPAAGDYAPLTDYVIITVLVALVSGQFDSVKRPRLPFLDAALEKLWGARWSSLKGLSVMTQAF